MNDATPRCAVPGSACRLLQLETPGTRPVWAVLDAAGARHFTGEVVLLTEPRVVVHFDKGEAYVAEREGDPSIASRLVALGVLTPEQLEQGVVRLDAVEHPVEHLGRLFERVPELDRDQVELALEVITSEVLGEIADHPVDEIRVASYRHHPSGVHRWLHRPVFVVASLGPDHGEHADHADHTDHTSGSGDQLVATAGDIALVEEYERLLADVPPVDQYAPTMALPVITPADESTQVATQFATVSAEDEPQDQPTDDAVDLTVDPAVEPDVEPDVEPVDSVDWAVEAAVTWPDFVEPEPEPASEPVAPASLLDEPVAVFGEPTIIWDLPIDGAPVPPAPDLSAPEPLLVAPDAIDLPDPAQVPEPAASSSESSESSDTTGSGGLEMPSFDIASIMQQMARGGESDGGSDGSGMLPPEIVETEVDDDVKAAVRAALAEIEAATRGEVISQPESAPLPAFATELGVDGQRPVGAQPTAAPAPPPAAAAPVVTPSEPPAPPTISLPPNVPTPYLPGTPRPGSAAAATTEAGAADVDPIGAAIASVAAELPEALGEAVELPPLEPLPVDDAPTPPREEQPAGGLRRLIGIRKT